MARSDILTNGIRWKIVGLGLVTYLIPRIVIGFVIQNAVTSENWRTMLWVNIGIEVLFGILLAVMLAVVYHDARSSSEGLESSQIASVFD